MPIVIDCPSCERKLRVPDDLMGQKVKCPTCGTTFDAAPSVGPRPTPPAAVPEPTSAPAPAPPVSPMPLTQDTSAAPPTPFTEQAAGVTTHDAAPRREAVAVGDTQPCPYCGERINKNATRCKYCEEDVTSDGEDDEEDDRPWDHGHPAMVRRDCDPHRASTVLTMGIISLVAIACFGPIGLPFGIIAWVMGSKDLRKMRAKEMDPAGLGMTQAGWICGIIGTILDSLFALGCVAYIGFVTYMISATARPMTPGGRPVTVPAPPPTVTKPMQPINPQNGQQKDKAAPFVPPAGPPGGQIKDKMPPKNPAGVAPKEKVQAPQVDRKVEATLP